MGVQNPYSYSNAEQLPPYPKLPLWAQRLVIVCRLLNLAAVVMALSHLGRDVVPITGIGALLSSPSLIAIGVLLIVAIGDVFTFIARSYVVERAATTASITVAGLLAARLLFDPPRPNATLVWMWTFATAWLFIAIVRRYTISFQTAGVPEAS